MAKTSELLIDYGYTEAAPGLFIPGRPSSERWEAVEGGWHCYVPAGAWGREMPGGLVQVPFTQAEAFATASGLHPAQQPDAFDWVWPDARMVEIYSHLAGPDGNEWHKDDEGNLIKG